jgi:hypothetical protein
MLLQYIKKGDTTHIFFCKKKLGTEILEIDDLFFQYTTGSGCRRFLLPSKKVIFHRSMRKHELGQYSLYILESIVDKEFLVKGLNNLVFKGMHHFYSRDVEKLIRKSGIKVINTDRTFKHVLNLNKFKGKEEKSPFLDEKLGDFYHHTRCEFKACKMPKRPPNYVSYTRNGDVSSVYWYGYNNKGYYVIRLSDHWCRITKKIENCSEQLHGDCDRIASCWWTLVGNSSTMCGKAYKSDFTKNFW